MPQLSPSRSKDNGVGCCNISTVLLTLSLDEKGYFAGGFSAKGDKHIFFKLTEGSHLSSEG